MSVVLNNASGFQQGYAGQQQAIDTNAANARADAQNRALLQNRMLSESAANARHMSSAAYQTNGPYNPIDNYNAQAQQTIGQYQTPERYYRDEAGNLFLQPTTSYNNSPMVNYNINQNAQGQAQQAEQAKRNYRDQMRLFNVFGPTGQGPINNQPRAPRMQYQQRQAYPSGYSGGANTGYPNPYYQQQTPPPTQAPPPQGFDWVKNMNEPY